jgi:hypothetical protein
MSHVAETASAVPHSPQGGPACSAGPYCYWWRAKRKSRVGKGLSRGGEESAGRFGPFPLS